MRASPEFTFMRTDDRSGRRSDRCDRFTFGGYRRLQPSFATAEGTKGRVSSTLGLGALLQGRNPPTTAQAPAPPLLQPRGERWDQP